MNFEYKIIASVGVLVFVSLVLITSNPDEIPYWNSLQEIQPIQLDTCNYDCKMAQEKRDMVCIETDTDEYYCRPDRKILWENEIVQIKNTFPPDGEFAYFPQGKVIEEKNKLFDIGNVALLNNATKEIRIDFTNHFPQTNTDDFEYSASLLPGDTFVSHCLGGDSKTAHIVEYVDTFTLEGIIYVEFWGRHVTMPDELLPCKMPELIQQTLPLDLRMGVDWKLG